MAPWVRVDKGDVRCRMLADEHYTRQSVGHPMWTRPGYNFCLYAETDPWWGFGSKAVWCWWRPKWEDGINRKDGLRALECTMFRLDGPRPHAWLASELVAAAVAALGTVEAEEDLNHFAPHGLRLITGIGEKATAKHRGRNNRAGHCFRMAGWRDLDHNPGRADCWLEAA